jgi:hypothetical protein
MMPNQRQKNTIIIKQMDIVVKRRKCDDCEVEKGRNICIEYQKNNQILRFFSELKAY